MKLRSKLISTILPLVIFPALGIGTVSMLMQQETSTEATIRGMTSILDETDRQVAGLLEQARSNISLFAQSPFLERYMLTEDESVRWGLMQQRLMDIFESYQKAYPDYVEIRVLTPDGFEDTRTTVGLIENAAEDEGDSAWFQEMSSSQDSVFLKFVRLPEHVDPVLLIGRRLEFLDPAVSQSGDEDPLRGYLVVTVGLADIKSSMAADRNGDSVRVDLVSESGEMFHVQDDDGKTVQIMPDLHEDLLLNADSREPIVRDAGGKKRVLLSRRLDQGVLIVGAQEYSDVIAASRRLVILSMAMVLLTTLVSAGLLILLIDSGLVRRFRSLHEAAVRMGDGFLLTPINVKGQDEISELGKSLQDMGAQLHESRQVEEHRKKELQKSNDSLELAVADAESARETAEYASKAKSEFLARMSHEIRTPMNGVLGMTELLLRTNLETRQKRYAHTIHQSAESLLHIINDILDFSKIEAGKFTLETNDFNLREIIEDSVELIAVRAHEKRLNIAAVIPPELPPSLLGDAFRLRQVLTNLLGNAIKFTDQGEVVVRVDLKDSPGDRAGIRIHVIDTGIGIAADHVDKVFESFIQEDGSTTRRYGGTGLGLAISRQIIELMGGHIGVNSVLGEGSDFWFELEFPHGNRRSFPPPANIAELGGLNALLIDDNDTNLEILDNYCGAWGMRRTTASTVAEALDCLQPYSGDARFDIAILDMKLPDGTGLELARRIREMPRHQGLKLIVLSSIARDIESAERRRLSIGACLMKPVRQSTLRDALLTSLGSDDYSKTATYCPVDGNAQEELPYLEVLLVEDNIVNQQVALGMLKSLGCSTDTALNGQEAMTAISRRRYDLVLMDCQMPVMDGFEATRQQRAREHKQGNNHLPIIALTANAVDGDRERCIQAGMDDYLAKPFTRDALAEVLRRQASSTPHHVDHSEAGADTIRMSQIQAVQETGESDLLASVIDTYLVRSRMLISGRNGIEAAADAGDFKPLGLRAHGLKTAAAALGATRMVALSSKLVDCARNGELTQSRELVIEIAEEQLAVIETLKKLARDEVATA